MAREFFTNVSTLDELRTVYKTLLKQFHPDNGGTVEQCAKLNAEYKVVFDQLKNAKSTESESSNFDPFQYDDCITEMLYKIVNLEGLDIELCGIWIWIGGNAYPHKEALKSLGFMWSKAKKLWHWSPVGNGFHSRGRRTMDSIRATYGSHKVQSRPVMALE